MAEVIEKGVTVSTANITVPTTGETVVITSPQVKVPLATCRVVVKAWAQHTLGTGTTGVTPRIRRGTTTADPLVGEGTVEAIKTAAGSTEPFVLVVSELLENVESVRYSYTLQQTGATANGITGQASIEVEILNG